MADYLELLFDLARQSSSESMPEYKTHKYKQMEFIKCYRSISVLKVGRFKLVEGIITESIVPSKDQDYDLENANNQHTLEKS